MAENYKEIIDNIADVIYIYNIKKNKWTYMSASILYLTGFTIDEVIKKNIQELLTYDSMSDYLKKKMITVKEFEEDRSKNVNTFVYKLICKDGNSIWVEMLEKYKYNANGDLEAFGTMKNCEKRKNAEESISRSEKRFRELFDRAPLGYQSLNSDGKFITVNEQWCNILGYKKEEVIGKRFSDFLSPNYQEKFKVRFPLFKSKGYIHSEFEMYHKNGERIFIAFDGKIGVDESDNFKQTHCILKDITTEKRLENELAQNRDLLNSLLDNTTDAIYIKDIEGKYLLINKAGEKLMGKSSTEIIGKDDASIITFKEEKAIVETDRQVLESYSTITFEEQITNKKGELITFLSTKGPVFNTNNELIGLFGIARDISERKKAEQKLIHLSYYDQLTGLHNRRFYEEELARLNDNKNLPIALIMADVNGLKFTNDAFGHQEGDFLLKTIGEILKRECPSDEMIFRIGGDEFVIILPKTTAIEAKSLIDRINTVVMNTLSLKVISSLSIGYALKENPSDNMNDVFKEAENDMYRQKLTEKLSSRSKTIDLMMNSLYEKNNREMLHSNRVASICEVIAMNMNFDQIEIKQIRTAGLVHDIGKIGIRNTILDKTEKLNTDEWEEIKKHCEVGFRILNTVDEFSEIAKYVLSHQERWDGKGYPQGLKGKEIPIQSRIIAVADAFDAMSSDRPYRLAMNKEDAILELKKCAGEQFDSDIVDIFVEKVIEKLG
ncbi:PAS domain S-box protein [Clostridium sp. DL1XJH146]